MSALDTHRFLLRLFGLTVIAGAVTAAWLLVELFALTFLAVVMAVFWSDAAARLRRPGRLRIVPRWMTVFFVVFASMAFTAALFVLLLGPAVMQARQFASLLPTFLRDLWMRVQPELRSLPGMAEFDPAAIQLDTVTREFFTSGLGVVTTGVSWSLMGVTLFFVALFLALEPERYRDGLVALLPQPRQRKAAQMLARAQRGLLTWTHQTALRLAVTGTLFTAILLLLGFEFALFFGLAAAVLQIVPFLGPLLGLVGPLVTALAVAPGRALPVTMLYLLILGLQDRLLIPRVLRWHLNLPAPLLLILIIGMARILGVLGVLLAAPALTAALLLLETGLGPRWTLRVLEPARAPAPAADQD